MFFEKHDDYKAQELAKCMIELWDLIDVPIDEQKPFNHLTRLLSESVDEVRVQRCLSTDIIEQAEVEILCLKVLKVSTMKNLEFKRQTELEQIYKEVHMDVDNGSAS
ncbi:hypothetical protein HN51_062361 [Arachis hypogaea]